MHFFQQVSVRVWMAGGVVSIIAVDNWMGGEEGREGGRGREKRGEGKEGKGKVLFAINDCWFSCMMNCWSSFLSLSVSLERSTFVSIVRGCGGKWRDLYRVSE